ncbi:hypothetical protein I79_023442 [Cricetulus griseus]|uniref:Uncharacterized protein n=1 Tax=Cricetulus griseus TaxID=10029 RepID=G3IHY2_CRIGR|nr:hypothetical protein I79_023442 [Cricetulus griseus]
MDLCEFAINLVNKATQRNPIWKNKQTNKQKHKDSEELLVLRDVKTADGHGSCCRRENSSCHLFSAPHLHPKT